MLAVHRMYKQQNINEVFGLSKAERQGREAINQLQRDATRPKPSGPQIRITSGEQLNKKRDFFNVR